MIMTSKLFITFAFLLIFKLSFSTEPILVTESTIVLDIDETKELYFSFAEGDEIVFNMQMVKGKHIKELQIIEMPTNTLLTEFKTKGVRDKRIQIRNKGIYKFRFYSSSLTRRVCKIQIHRIPKDDTTKRFNTNWKWKTLRDTTYVAYKEDSLVGYQTIKYKETIKELKETKLEEIMLFEKSQRVHSYYNENVSRTYLKVDLPLLTTSALREENLIAWSYWIGVGQEGQQAYQNNIKAIANLASDAVNVVYQNPLAGIAVGSISELMIPQTGEDVKYYFILDYQNVQLFYKNQQFMQFDMGKGKAAYGRNDKLKEGVFYIGLSNDNKLTGIDVDVKVLAVKEIKIYENIIYDREKEQPKYITLNKTRMDINETKIRIPVE